MGGDRAAGRPARPGPLRRGAAGCSVPLPWTIGGGKVALEPFAALDAGARAALDADAAGVTRFLGG